MNKRLRTFAIALMLGAIASATGAALFLIPNDQIPLFHDVSDLNAHFAALENAGAFGFRAPEYDSPNADIGIVTIDDASLASGVPGPWPFARGYYGALLAKLHAAGAVTVVFDIEFIDRSKDPSQDARFAAAMRTIPTVLAYTIDTTSRGQIGASLPAPTLRPSAAAIGYTTVDTPGGILIGAPLEITTDATGTANRNERLASLPASAFRTYAHTAGPLGVPLLDGHTFILVPPRVERRQDPRTGTQALLPAFAGRGTISFSDAYRMNPRDLAPFARGALVFVGSSATGLGDFVSTARGRIGGLFVNARFADQLLRKIFVRPVPRSLDLALIVAFPLLVALAFSAARTPLAIAISLGSMAVFAYANLALFITKLVWVDLVHVMLAGLLATLLIALYRVLDEGAQRRLVTNLFGMHVSPAVVAEIIDRNDPNTTLALAGKRVTATIFYSDIRGFTAMSERMTPEHIYEQLNEYFEAMCAIIFAHGGYVDKFIGDCVMAVFSAPYQTPDDARQAVRAAIAQQRTITELSATWRSAGKADFTAGMGIHTGEVVMGNLGSRTRMNYTVVGDTVNLAARLYNVAKAGEIIISYDTYHAVSDEISATELEPVTVKGKSDPIRIFSVRY